MPRYDMPSPSGFEEAARFDREYPLPRNSALYSSRRAAAYPDTPWNLLPEATKPSKDAYKERARENDRVRDRYFHAEAQEKRVVESQDEWQRQYYQAHSKGITPPGHRRLEPIAGELAEAELRSV